MGTGAASVLVAGTRGATAVAAVGDTDAVPGLAAVVDCYAPLLRQARAPLLAGTNAQLRNQLNDLIPQLPAEGQVRARDTVAALDEARQQLSLSPEDLAGSLSKLNRALAASAQQSAGTGRPDLSSAMAVALSACIPPSEDVDIGALSQGGIPTDGTPVPRQLEEPLGE
jgi:hypothetical protein